MRILLLTFLLLASFGARAETKLTIGSASNSEGALPVFVARDLGLLKAAGIEIEIVDFKGGAPAAQALAGGSIDLCICAADHVVRLRSRNLDGVIAVALDTRHSYALLARSDSPYADLKALKGKRIGITSAGSFTDNTIRYFIKTAGLDADRDYEIVGAGVAAAMKAAIDSAKVDAGMVITIEAAEMLRQTGKYKIVQDFRDIPYPALVILARERWMNSNAETAKAFTKALLQAEKMIHDDPAMTTGVLKKIYTQFDETLLRQLAVDAQRRLSIDGLVDPASYKTMVDMVLFSDSTLKSIPYEQAIFRKYLD